MSELKTSKRVLHRRKLAKEVRKEAKRLLGTRQLWTDGSMCKKGNRIYIAWAYVVVVNGTIIGSGSGSELQEAGSVTWGIGDVELLAIVKALLHKAGENAQPVDVTVWSDSLEALRRINKYILQGPTYRQLRKKSSRLALENCPIEVELQGKLRNILEGENIRLLSAYKVPAHRGLQYNVIVDKMAGMALNAASSQHSTSVVVASS